jgi:hypothetical protein
MVQTRSGALEGGENIGPGQSSTKPPSLMIRHKREKFYRNLLKTVNAPQAGKVSSMLHYVRIAEMLLCINKYIPQTSGPTVPSSYAGALISDLKNSNNFLEMLKCAEQYRDKSNMVYMKSLNNKNLKVIPAEAISIDNSIMDYDLGILVQRPYAQECVDPSSSKDHEIR